MIRFHLDEHVDGTLAVALRARGIEVTTTAEAGLLDADDEAHIDFALRENRVIVTHDRDYLAKNAEGLEHAGIAYCHQQKHSFGQLLTMCLLLSECCTQEEMRGRVEYL
jgi:uncharacterized protein with PIN domain